VDMTTQLIPPATKRKRALRIIADNVHRCDTLSDTRLDKCKLHEQSDLSDVIYYLKTTRMFLFSRSADIQNEFTRQIKQLI